MSYLSSLPTAQLLFDCTPSPIRPPVPTLLSSSGPLHPASLDADNLLVTNRYAHPSPSAQFLFNAWFLFDDAFALDAHTPPWIQSPEPTLSCCSDPHHPNHPSNLPPTKRYACPSSTMITRSKTKAERAADLAASAAACALTRVSVGEHGPNNDTDNMN